MALLVEVTKDNFEQEVLQDKLPVLVDFWGPRCVPCMGLMPLIEELAARYQGKMKFCKLNSAENRRFMIELRVMSLPTFRFYQNGELAGQLQGDFGQEEIEEKIKAVIGQ